MKSESPAQKIKKVIKEKDSRFWLMLFVTTSTIFILVLWSMNLRKIFPENVSLASDSSALGLDSINNNMDSISDDISFFLDRLDKVERESAKEEGTNSNINQTELDEIKKALEDKINGAEKNNTTSDSGLDSSTTSSIPILSKDLDNSEQEIRELKKRLEELENKLGQ